jgi:hypothetical protein
MSARRDLTGQRFGKRLVLGFAAFKSGKRSQWHVRCDCGQEFTCLNQDLKREGPCRWCGHRGPRPYRRKRPYEWRYNTAVNKARHAFLLSYDEFFEFTKTRECHYCGIGIDWGPAFGKKRSSGLNLDRKDNNRPYEKENVVVACRRCNYGKNNFFSYEEWKQIGNVIRSWRTK